MKAKFEKGQEVQVTKANDETVTGVIKGWDYNCCTFDVQYDVDYVKDGNVWTLICVPEECIELI